MAGKLTRNFTNFHHPRISEEDFAGSKAILDNRYKLVVDGERLAAGNASEPVRELFDLRNDQAEENNLIDSQPETANKIAEDMQRELRDWQQSVLNSLTGADYG
jgi:arylsulfatase A-like enzyme